MINQLFSVFQKSDGYKTASFQKRICRDIRSLSGKKMISTIMFIVKDSTTEAIKNKGFIFTDKNRLV